MSELRMDGIPLGIYLQDSLTRFREDGQTPSKEMFWASNERTGNDAVRDVLQIEFSGERLVNHISLQVSRFPHRVTAEFWDPLSDNWLPLREQIADIEPIDPAYDISAQRAKWEGDPVQFTVTDSYPAQIDATANARSLGLNHHPQHFGTAHWVNVKWRTVPVLTRAIRLILVRSFGFEGQSGYHPVGPSGTHIMYSLAVKNFAAGYRVYSPTDIPASARATMGDFSTSTTYLGARLNYRIKEHKAEHVIEGVDGLHWKSEPQPVNYSVVNFFLDVRDSEGEGQPIDRIYIDPLTVGPTMNLYYTQDDPDSDFEADDTALTFPLSQTHGAELVREMDPLAYHPVGIIFPDEIAYGRLDNSYLQWEHHDRPWTLGVALRPGDLEGTHPICAWAGNTLRIRDHKIEFVAADGRSLHVDVPDYYQDGSEINVVLAYIPRDDEKFGPPDQRYGERDGYDPRFGGRTGRGAPGTPDNPWPGLSDSFIPPDGQIGPVQPLPMTAPNPRTGTSSDPDPEWDSRYQTWPGSKFGAPGYQEPRFGLPYDPNPAPPELGSGEIPPPPPLLHDEEEDMRLSPGTITLKVGTGQDPELHEEKTLGIMTPERFMGERPDFISIGSYTSQSHPGTANFVLRGMVLVIDKMPMKGWIDGFINDPDLFILKDNRAASDLTTNALVRLHPSFASDDNPLGAVGGPGHRYNDVTWTPVSRDYTLRQGYIRFPGVRAKHFKMEFTNLVMQTFENLVPIRRRIRLFPTDLVRRQGRDLIAEVHPGYRNPVQPPSPMGAETRHYEYTGVAPGVQTMMDLVGVNNYGWALAQLRIMEEHVRKESRTEGYVADHPKAAEELRKAGWVWSYSPWHVGSSSPKWDRQQPHVYEEVEVDHESRVGFVVGLRRVVPVRVDYLTDDDTEVYEEPFLDNAHIEDIVSMEYTQDGISPVSHSASIISKTFPSVRQVRGLQFATIQSDNQVMLDDDGFVEDDLSLYWRTYGDATVRRVPRQGVVVKRGWAPRTYAHIEEHDQTYARMEDGTYANLETVNYDGTVGGGLDSLPVEASDAGRVFAAARVSAISDLAGPVRMEIVSVDRGVLAATERELAAGEKATLKIGYRVGSAHEPTTYADLEERTYQEMEQETYGDLHTDPIGGPFFLRVYQVNPSQDEFVIERMSLFDAPVVWEFSVDDGDSWHDALDIRNNPRGVLTFPEPGKSLKWRAKVFHIDAEISHLVIRPWYGGLLGIVDRSADDYIGPNRSVIDDYPDVEDDPMWSRWDPIPEWWYHRDVASRYGSAPNIIYPGDLILPDTSLVENRTLALIRATEDRGGKVWRQPDPPPAGNTSTDPEVPDDRALDLWLNTSTNIPYMWDSQTKGWVLA